MERINKENAASLDGFDICMVMIESFIVEHFRSYLELR